MHQPEHVEDQSVDVVLTNIDCKRISTLGTLIFTEHCIWHEMSKREKFAKFFVISHRNFITSRDDKEGDIKDNT